MEPSREQIEAAITDNFSDLTDDETRSGQICPACEGGSTKEGSLSITRRGGRLLFYCHRAQCNVFGSAPVGRGTRRERSQNKPENRYPEIQVSPANQALLKLLSAKFRIPRKVLQNAGVGWTGEGSGRYARRVCYPIFGPDSRERGKNYRSYEQGVQPKAIIQLKDKEQVAASWYKFIRRSSTLVLVEDQVSAIRLAPFTHSLALLGVNVSEAKVEEILAAEPKYQQILLSLDEDATLESIKQALKWKNRINLLVVPLQKDIKNMDAREFQEYLNRIKLYEPSAATSTSEASVRD